MPTIDKVIKDRETVLGNLSQIEYLRKEKTDRYRSVQDFTQADAITTDAAIKAIANINLQISSLEKQNKKILSKYEGDLLANDGAKQDSGAPHRNG